MKKISNTLKIILLKLFAFVCIGANAQISASVDHHTHIWSLEASKLVTEPLMQKVALPAELQELLDKKQKSGGRKKDTAAFSQLYNRFSFFKSIESKHATMAEGI